MQGLLRGENLENTDDEREEFRYEDSDSSKDISIDQSAERDSEIEIESKRMVKIET